MKRTRQPTPLGIEIKTALLRQNMTVRELAEKIRKSEATVCEIISGKNRSVKTRNMILRELKLSVEEEYILESGEHDDGIE